MLTERTIYWLVVCLTSIWLAALVAAPWLLATEHTLPALVFYRVSALVCHQQPSRSFTLYGFPLTLCARCTGLSVGFAICWLLAASFPVPQRRWLGLLVLPLLVDWGLGAGGWWENTLLSRALTGGFAGGAAAWWLRQALSEFRNTQSGEEFIHG